MIQTIKLPYITSNKALEYIALLQRQYSSVFRSAFNRCYLFDEIVLKDIRDSVKNLNNINEIDSWWLMCSVGDAFGFYKSSKERNASKIIFGGRNNLIKRTQNKISNEDWKELRLRRILSVGEKYQKGNRKFTFKIIEENKIIFKPKKKVHYELYLPKLRKNYKNLLHKIQMLMEEKKIPVTIALDKKYIYISFEETIQSDKKSEGSYAGLDLNPNYISLVLFNKNKKITNQWTWKLNKLTKKNSEYNNNKLKNETIEISKKISQICRHYKIDFVFFEKLNIKTDNKHKGRNFNRLCNNTWKRNLFLNNLKKRLDVLGIKWFEINPAYSSFIGNIVWEYPDSISAACEIARRGYEVIIQKLKTFYPKLQVGLVQDRWKKTIQDNEFEDWKEFYNFVVKNLKLKYRVSWSEDWVFREYKTNKSLCDVCYKRLNLTI